MTMLSLSETHEREIQATDATGAAEAGEDPFAAITARIDALQHELAALKALALRHAKPETAIRRASSFAVDGRGDLARREPTPPRPPFDGRSIVAIERGEATAVRAMSASGRGAVLAGGTAAVRLLPGDSPGHPDAGCTGDLVVDVLGRLWFCRGGVDWTRLD